MTDAERKAEEAKRLLDETKPYFEQIEREEYEALLVEADPLKVQDRRLQILAIRRLRSALQTAITVGTQSARKAPAVA
jgi:hypothetical protein